MSWSGPGLPATICLQKGGVSYRRGGVPALRRWRQSRRRPAPARQCGSRVVRQVPAAMAICRNGPGSRRPRPLLSGPEYPFGGASSVIWPSKNRSSSCARKAGRLSDKAQNKSVMVKPQAMISSLPRLMKGRRLSRVGRSTSKSLFTLYYRIVTSTRRLRCSATWSPVLTMRSVLP